MMTRRRSFLPALAAALTGAAIAQSAGAESCTRERFEGTEYAVCRVNLARDELRLWYRDDQGAPLYRLGAVADRVASDGDELIFAMNAGMYHEDRDPVGLLVIEGKRYGQLVTRAGPGNFGMRPNGVFCWGRGRGAVIESRRFARERPACRYATQSGPMLVIDGKLHPRFRASGTSRYVRNGVGVSRDGRTAIFALSRRAVNFHSFARFFRDRLQTPNALYLDGSVSRLYAPAIGLGDRGGSFGPMVGLVRTAPPPVPVPKPAPAGDG